MFFDSYAVFLKIACNTDSSVNQRNSYISLCLGWVFFWRSWLSARFCCNCQVKSHSSTLFNTLWHICNHFSPTECLISPALGPNPGFVAYNAAQNKDNATPDVKKIPFLAKDFAEWMEASTLKIGDTVCADLFNYTLNSNLASFDTWNIQILVFIFYSR